MKLFNIHKLLLHSFINILYIEVRTRSSLESTEENACENGRKFSREFSTNNGGKARDSVSTNYRCLFECEVQTAKPQDVTLISLFPP